MYFWKIDNLKEDIKTSRLPEKDRFIYALSKQMEALMVQIF